MQRSMVDLPEPEPPMIATTSPSRAVSDTPFSTSWVPKLFPQIADADGDGGFRPRSFPGPACDPAVLLARCEQRFSDCASE